MQNKDLETFYPTNRQEWREWLTENHRSKQFIWLVCYKKKTNMPTLSWSEAVEEALCFGWIDSTRNTVNDEKFVQLFSKRKAKSTWSKVNKEKVLLLIEQGLMTQAGHESIEIAKQNGSWIILDEVEALSIPTDLEEAFKANPDSMDYFLSLSKSVKKGILQWIVLAKRTETRAKRINEIVVTLAQKLKPRQF
ncbi:YdeI/OmpD-associated family protein [Arcicella aquatica]|uniref:YdeI/OmpD-associated family protein n=1 Tax=Arcicella aquatica TaxID=217141 RepID=A0ABU5QI47_9BACT|nr:YdeI/OmpD-associated family protein [Arcicella aquatica]MEA5256610.1 YdeI/OmpD-associated family protein [Arcicella aquatica]